MAPIGQGLVDGDPTLRLMFYRPEIPSNTGNALRLAAALGAELHLVRPLGFRTDDAAMKRAGLDYAELARLVVHVDLAHAWAAIGDARVFAFTSRGSMLHSAVSYQAGDVLLFGPEPTGLPAEVLADGRVTARVRIPMRSGVRSLNLANAAAVAGYEAWRQLRFRESEPQGGSS
jgi:tRNA (cytidine/uridine-2'-O-)-methyltransferase